MRIFNLKNIFFKNFPDILNRVAIALKELEYENVVVITNAKVPIVKFESLEEIIGE